MWNGWSLAHKAYINVSSLFLLFVSLGKRDGFKRRQLSLQHKQAFNSREYDSTEATARVGITIQESEKAEAFPFEVELI